MTGTDRGALIVDRRALIVGATLMAVVVGGSPALALDAGAEDAQRRADLVIANRFLGRRGLLEGLGHVSARSAADPAHFFLSRSLAPELVTASDIMTFDADSRPLGGDARRPYGERFIHGEIYRSRPDVQAIVHSHAAAFLPFGLVGIELKPLIHTAGFLDGGTPVFDLADTFGPGTNMLVDNGERGAALARKLGRSSMALMRGHGATITAPGIKEAVYRTVYAALDAEVQERASRLGKAKPLSSAEAKASDDINEGPALGRIWDLWAHSVQP